MKYLLYKAVLDEAPEIEITEDEYEKLKEARSLLSSALAIEINYEILINNYLDFEKHLLNMSIDCLVRNDSLDYLGFFEVRLNMNIRLINLLTACRLYFDQLEHHTKNFAVYITDIAEQVEKLRSNEYDSNKEYRFIEALRNYVQHRGLPVHWILLNRRRTRSEDDHLLEYSIELASLRSYLEEDGKFKKKVLAELDEKIDIKVATRSYLDSISNVHKSVSYMISDRVSSSRQLINSPDRF